MFFADDLTPPKPPLQNTIRDAISSNMESEYHIFDDVELAIADECARYIHDPYGWAMWAFDWGHGELEGFDGLDTWQEDWLKTVGEQIRANKFDGVVPVPPIRMATASGHGIGKGHPLDMPYRGGTWGDLKPGDLVFDSKGELTPVKGVRHYKREHYRVTFDDGSSTIVSGQHEWKVKGRNERRRNLDWTVLETQDILARGVKRPNGVSMARQWEIPVQAPAKYPECVVPVDAYTYGVWLGDGDKRSGRITNLDQEVWDSIAYDHKADGPVRTAYGLLSDLKTHDLFGCTTYTAAVDPRYLESDQRLNVLQGLLDTDGWVEKCGSAAFCSASRQLVRDVVWIARSLGLKAREEKFKPNDKAGAWTTHITWDGETTLFRIERKQSRLVKAEHRYQCRWIDSIVPVGIMDGMCIEVEGGLYLTDDFHVTHNSALTSIVILFIMSTRPQAKGVVTANTGEQLRTKTWSELAKWKARCITGDWFELNSGKGSMSMHHKSWPESWRVDAQTCREENSEAFAGLHSANSTPFYIFDEASAVPDKIWEVAEGGLTDGEPMFFCFGNPTRNTGAFRQKFDNNRWTTKQIDSRTAKMTNKKLFAEWAEEWGEDSDFFRVRVKGVFPRAGDMQFIPGDVVDEAAKRSPGRYLGDDPLICGFDVARGGDDNCYIVFRRGKDAKSEKVYRIPGEKSRDSMRVVSMVTMILDRHQPDVTFIDVTGIGGPIGDRLRQLGYHVTDVGFGHKADDDKLYHNKTSEMGYRLRQWLMDGGAIHDDDKLVRELTEREFWHNDKGQLVVEPKKLMKERLLYSPDWGDALYLTFAQHVPKRQTQRDDRHVAVRGSRDEYDSLANFEGDQ